MIQRRRAALDKRIDIRAARHVRAGSHLDRRQLRDSGRLNEFSGEMHAFAQQRDVERVAQEAGIGNGCVKDVGRRGFDATAGVRVLEAEHDDAVGPDDFEEGGIFGSKLLVQRGVLLCVALGDAGGHVGGEGEGGGAGGGLGCDGAGGVGVG